MEAIEVLKGVDGIQFCHFEHGDVVRHQLVQRIVCAYDGYVRGQRELPLEMPEDAMARGDAAKTSGAPPKLQGPVHTQ